MRGVVGVAVAITLAAVAVLSLGSSSSLVGPLALAAVTPPLARVDLAEHRLPNRMVVPALLAGVAGLGLSWLGSGVPPVVPSDPQVVALGHVVGEHHARVLADAAEHGE
ncbi:MAG: hypothetical protein ABUT11_04865, partial [Leifsonia sp.]